MDQITQYLQEVAAQECQLYTQKKLLSNLSHQAAKLGIAKKIHRPDKWEHYKFQFELKSTFFLSLFFSILSIVYYFVKMISSGTNQKLGVKYSKAMFTSPIMWFFISFVLIIVCRNICDLIVHYTEGRSIYNSKLRTYNTAIQNDQQRVQRELQQKEMLIGQYKIVKQETLNTESALNALYSLNIIHQKYRNLVAVSLFYDYFDTGRCVSLTGPGGAYATYEEDLRFKRIETRLDVIISKLDEIIENQQYIGDLMREANNTLNRIENQNKKIAKSLNRIEENTELTEYNTRCAAKSAAIMEHISVYYFLSNQ